MSKRTNAWGMIASVWRHPIGYVALVGVAALAYLGPIEASIRRALAGRLSWDALNALAAVFNGAVMLGLFLRWRRVAWRGPAPRRGLLMSAACAAVLLAYCVLRTRSWHSVSAEGVLLIAAEALGVAVTEELIFRGFVFGALEPRYGRLRAVVASSAIFGVVHLAGLFHGSEPAVVAVRVAWATGLGMLFAGLLVCSGTYVVPIAAHALVNIIAGMADDDRFPFVRTLRASIDMLVATPLLALLGVYISMAAGARRRILAVGVGYAGLATLLLATGALAWALDPTGPRVVSLDRTGNPMEMTLRFAVPASWAGYNVRTRSSYEGDSGIYDMALSRPARSRAGARGEDHHSKTIEFSGPGRWQLRVRFHSEILFERDLDIRGQ